MGLTMTSLISCPVCPTLPDEPYHCFPCTPCCSDGVPSIRDTLLHQGVPVNGGEICISRIIVQLLSRALWRKA